MSPGWVGPPSLANLLLPLDVNCAGEGEDWVTGR